MYDFRNKRVTVIGLGVSNTPLIGWLLERGAIVTARDKKDFSLLPEKVKEFADAGVAFVLGEGYLNNIEADYIFKSPGIRFDIPELAEAVSRGAVLTSEMELFFELCPAKTIGITGSDGKTTTTTLIYKCLAEEFGENKVFVGGNIGKPLLPELDKMDGSCFAVVELSSFQLHTMKKSPDIAVITNISPNHLDYHRDMEEYTEAKKNIFLNAKPGSILVLNGENNITKELGKFAPNGCEVRYFINGFTELDGEYITYDGEKILKKSDILIPGRHNAENFAAVITALRGIVSNDTVNKIAGAFGGVEHRIELVRVLDGVKYYNSSIDSSPTRTAAALNSFKEKLIVICGGYDKHIPFEPLAVSLCDRAKKVILTGATAEKIKSALLSCSEYKNGQPEIINCPDFSEAINAARVAAVYGDTVILSPACASFDAFPNFEVRGNTFKKIVNGF